MIVFSYCQAFHSEGEAKTAGAAYKRTHSSIDYGVKPHGVTWRLKISFEYDENIVRKLEMDGFRVCT
jgi:hypothetical protein